MLHVKLVVQTEKYLVAVQKKISVDQQIENGLNVPFLMSIG